MNNNEIGKEVKNANGLLVSTMGNAKYPDGRIPTMSDSNGYVMVYAKINGFNSMYFLHRLVAETFIPNPDNLPCVNHLNEIRNDNRVENLEGITYSDNTKYSMDRHVKWERGKYKERHVVAIDPETNHVVGIYVNVRIAAKVNSDKINSVKVSIYKALDSSTCYSAIGYIWKQIDNDEMLNLYGKYPDLFNVKLPKKKRTLFKNPDALCKCGKKRIFIKGTDDNGNEKVYNAIGEAVRESGIAYKTIKKYCDTGLSFKGYTGESIK